MKLQVEAAAAKPAAESELQASQTGFGVYNCPDIGGVARPVRYIDKKYRLSIYRHF